jgi:hypothetical protein
MYQDRSLVMFIGAASSGALAGQAKVLVDNELADARVSGSNDSKADDDGWNGVSQDFLYEFKFQSGCRT